jgi:Fe-S-cluster containining protein
MEYGCNDSCCAYGCSADIAEIDRILAYKDELEKRLGICAARWFTGDVIADVDYPSKYYRRTSVLNGHCIFHNINARGCLLHSMAIEKGIDPHLIKPMICFLFPVTWEWDYLHISDFLDELCCKQDGDFVLDSIMPELRYYLGDEMADELEHIRANLSEGIKKPAE